MITVLIGFTHRANILACSILGACAVIISIDHYIGSNLKYIFINVLRRATVENFEYAILSPPFQYRGKISLSTVIKCQGQLLNLAFVEFNIRTLTYVKFDKYQF